jgi:hypothetical protein
MKKHLVHVITTAVLTTAALAQSTSTPDHAVPTASTQTPAPDPLVAPPATPVPSTTKAQPGTPAAAEEVTPATTAPQVATAPIPPEHAVLELRALDKITGKASAIFAPLNDPVHFATLTITARTCYSTPPSETPETSAFLQIQDHRPDKPAREVFSGWMYASSPGLNGMQHPLYDVWVIKCITNAPGQQPSIVATVPVKPVSPNAGANEAMPTLPEDAGQ